MIRPAWIGEDDELRAVARTTLLLAAWAVMAVAGCAATHTTTGSAASQTAGSPTGRERAVAEAAAQVLKAADLNWKIP